MQEVFEGYRAIELYIDGAELRGGVTGLFLASAHVQLSLGFLGLWCVCVCVCVCVCTCIHA